MTDIINGYRLRAIADHRLAHDIKDQLTREAVLRARNASGKADAEIHPLVFAAERTGDWTAYDAAQDVANTAHRALATLLNESV